jgi:uncharacterized protein (TIGR00369 family)
LAADDEWRSRIERSFVKQGLMQTLGASLGAMSPGAVEIVFAPSPAISQQHGFIHGGAIAAIADTAAGYSALSLMAPGAGVLTAEFKINFLAPAAGQSFRASGRVVKAGRTLTLSQAEVIAENDGREKLVALLTATMMTIDARDDVID